MEERFTVSLLVTNHYGVLNRIAGLYGKRCYNIDSLSVGETEDPRLSRMTIVSTGDEYTKSQVIKQLNKLYDVKHAVLLEEEDAVSVEHLLIKLRTDGDGGQKVAALLNGYSGRIVFIGEHYIIADMTGTPQKTREFIEQCIPLGIVELCRSGSLSLSKTEKLVLSPHEVLD